MNIHIAKKMARNGPKMAILFQFLPPSGWLEPFADNHTLVQYFLFGSNAKILSELGFTPSVSLKNSTKLFSLSPATV